MVEIICGVISAAALVIVAVIENNNRKERRKREELDKARTREMKLSMDMMYATLQLSIVSSNALTGGHNNGNVEIAKKAAVKAQEEYETFLHETAAAAIT